MGLESKIVKRIGYIGKGVISGYITGNKIEFDVLVNPKIDKSKEKIEIDLSKLDSLHIKLTSFNNAYFLNDWIRKTFGEDYKEEEPVYLSEIDIKKIVKTCDEILADNSKADKLIKSDEYNENYFQTLKNLADSLRSEIDPEVNMLSLTTDFYYESL